APVLHPPLSKDRAPTAHTPQVTTKVETPAPSWAPKAPPYTQPRNDPIQSSLTCRFGPGGATPARSAAPAATTMATEAKSLQGPPGRNDPTSPNRPPTVAPARAAPTTKAVAVMVHRLWRARSPSGWMLESIDSPHGDQCDRMAARMATKEAATVIGRRRADCGRGWGPRVGYRRRRGSPRFAATEPRWWSSRCGRRPPWRRRAGP